MDANKLLEAIDFYEQGNSMAATARHFNSTPNTLKKLLRERGIHIRTQRESLILENKKRTKSINHDYFSVLTQENAYYLGFLAADGTVRKNRNEIKIGLSSLDKNFLLEFKSKLQTEKDVHIYLTNNGFECAELVFTSAQIKQDLMKYGIVPNKTKKGLNLDLIPGEFKLAFIKGFFDGDGSFSYNKNTKQGKMRFTSYTREILKQIAEYLDLQGRIYSDKRREQLFSLEFSTLPSIEILNKFYALDTPCLKRKKDKYDEFIQLRNNNPRDRNSSDEDEKLC